MACDNLFRGDGEGGGGGAEAGCKSEQPGLSYGAGDGATAIAALIMTGKSTNVLLRRCKQWGKERG